MSCGKFVSQLLSYKNDWTLEMWQEFTQKAGNEHSKTKTEYFKLSGSMSTSLKVNKNGLVYAQYVENGEYLETIEPSW